MMLIIIILIIIIAVLLAYIFRYKKDINYISRQIVRSKGGYCNIRMNTLNKDIENLVLNINDIYEMNQKINMKIKRNEEELRLSIANMSHDLRTPLTSIMGYVQLIKDGNLSEGLKIKYINIVERRTESLQSLIVSFYELSRIESDEYKFDLKTVNIGNVLCETIALFYNDFACKGIEPNINIVEKISPIICDEKAVMRIFSNLISNMLKHGEKNIKISLKKENSYIITQFTNNAPNLKIEDVAHIFDRFFTADVARSDKNTGLGLSITKALVEKLGYKIEAILVDGRLNIKITW